MDPKRQDTRGFGPVESKRDASRGKRRLRRESAPGEKEDAMFEIAGGKLSHFETEREDYRKSSC